MMVHGTEEQKKRYLPALLRGDDVWCQLFSEPGAGSDLAGLRDARRCATATSGSSTGRRCGARARTTATSASFSPAPTSTQPKHRGITYFVLDMRTPGIDVRPLRQITGVAHFNEVFLTDVRIPAENVVGAVNGGWCGRAHDARQRAPAHRGRRRHGRVRRLRPPGS